MPFGRYVNQFVRNLPTDYLQWLSSQEWIPEKYPHVWDAVTNELLLRGARSSSNSKQNAKEPKHSFPIPPELRPIAAEIVSRGYRSCSHRAHPDHAGGGHEQFIRLTAAKELLMHIVAEGNR